nr:hypothetical protein [Tanacetum cinerariifolium]
MLRGVSDLDPLSFADPRSRHPVDVAHLLKALLQQVTRSLGMPLSLPQSGLRRDPTTTTDSSGVPSTIERSLLDFANEARGSDQGVAALEVLPPEDVLAASAPEVGRAKEVAATDPSVVTESRKKATEGGDGVIAPPEVRTRGKAAEEVATLQKQVSGKEKLKAAFEEFKRYEDSRVEQRCAKMDAYLDALSIDFDEEL